MLKKLKQIWHEIIERWFLSTFYAERMERERMQLIAQLVERKETLWKNIPVGNRRTIKEIWLHKSITKKRISELMELEDEVTKNWPSTAQEVLNIVKEKENGNSKKDSNKESK